MHPGYQSLSYVQVGVATLLVLLNGGISLALGLGLGRRLLIAAARMTAQLLLIGLVLDWIFARSRWPSVVGLMLAMTVTAGVAAVRRTERRYAGVWVDSLIAVGVSSWVVTALALGAVVRAEPWYRPQYAIPFLGMILGNTLTGISLGLDRLGAELAGDRDRIEALLSLGATRWEAARPAVQRAIRAGMIPTLNAMAVMGIVSLPGMMTGQLLAGVDPGDAVKYQIVIMFLIASGTALGTVGVVLLGYRRLFNDRHQFREMLIVGRGGPPGGGR
jgi:putative ABC transport system permease protein